jgi:hypothetical protein
MQRRQLAKRFERRDDFVIDAHRRVKPIAAMDHSMADRRDRRQSRFRAHPVDRKASCRVMVGN